MNRNHLLPLCLGFAALAGSTHAAINVSGTTTYTQDFNTLPTGAARAEFNWTDDTTVPGFYLHRSNSPAAPQTNLAGALTTAAARPFIADGSEVATTAPNFHGFLNLGAYSSTDRALGFCPTGSDGATNWAGGELSIVAIITNNGLTPTDLTSVSFDIRALRGNSAAGNPETIALTAKTGAAAALLADLGTRTASATFSQTGWNPVVVTGGGNLNYTSSDGFIAVPAAPPSSVTQIGALLTPIRLAAGQSVALRWSDANDGGADAQVGIDNLSLSFVAPSAAVTASVSAIVRDDNGSPANPSDDKVNFKLMVNGTGAVSGAGWVISSSASFASSGLYGVEKSFTGVPISEFAAVPHTLTATVEDNGAPATNATFSVTAPWTTLTGTAGSFVYDDGGTPDDASNDTVTYQAAATGTYTGPDFSVAVNAGAPQTAAYGNSVPVTSGPGVQDSIVFTDSVDVTATATVLVNTPAIVGQNLTSGSPVNIKSLGSTGNNTWTFDGTARTMQMTDGDRNGAGTAAKEILSETVSLAGVSGVVKFSMDMVATDGSSGFEAADTFYAELILNDGTADLPPVNLISSFDTNANGILSGAEIVAANTAKTFAMSHFIPDNIQSARVVIRAICDSLAASERMDVSNLKFELAAPALAASAGAATLDNRGTIDPADDLLTAPVTITPVNLSSSGWTSGLTAPEGPATGAYSLTNPVNFSVLASSAPRTVTLSDNAGAITGGFSIAAPAKTLTATLVAGSIVRNPDSTVSFQVNVTPGNVGPAFTASIPALVLEEPNPTTVTGAGAYTPGNPVTLTLHNPPSNGSVVVAIADVSYPTTPAPVNVTVAVPAATTYVIGKKNFGAGLQDVISGTAAAVEWINYPALPSMVMTNGNGATDKIVETEEINLTAVGDVAFSAKFRAHEVSTGSNFETTDHFKAELIYSVGGVPQPPINLVTTWDTGAGAPSTTGTGENGAPDGYLNGYQGAAGTEVLPPNTVHATALADYDANHARDEFNAAGLAGIDKISNIFNLTGSVPANADSVKLVIYGAGINGSEGFALTDVLFTLGGPVDTDGDGMDDAWETTHGLAPNDAADKFLDADSDGQSNYAEYLAGTLPDNSASQLVFTASSFDSTTGAYAITWASVPGKTYRIQGSPDMTAGSWTDLSLSIPASAGSTTTSTGTFPGPLPAHSFFRVRVVP